MPLMPASDPVKATFERKIAALELEIRALQKRPARDENSTLSNGEVVFSYPGLIAVNEPSGEYLMKMTDGAIQRIDFTCLTAATSASTLSLRVNGTEKYALAIPSGTTLLVEDGIYVEVNEYDTLSLKFTTAGTGMRDVVVTVEYTQVT